MGYLAFVQTVKSTANQNLTTIGGLDWRHWTGFSQLSAFRKTNGQGISNLTAIGSITADQSLASGRTVTASDPTLSSDDSAVFFGANGTTGWGERLTINVGTKRKKVWLLLGQFSAAVTVAVSLSDSSATPISFTYAPSSIYATEGLLVEFDVDANSNGQTATVDITCSTNVDFGRIAVQAVAVSEATNGGGLLAASAARTADPNPLTVNLTTKGGADYLIPTGENSYQVKNITTNLFTTPTRTWSFTGATSNPSGYQVTGTDGKNSPASFTYTTLHGGFVDAGQYWETTLPAGTSERTVEGIFQGPFGHDFAISATLSDNSASQNILVKNSDASGTGDYVFYSLTYKAASAGQTLTIRVTSLGNANQLQVGWVWVSNESSPPSLQDVAPPLLTNNQTFYGPVIDGGGVSNIAPPLLTNEQTFFSPTVSEVAVIVTNKIASGSATGAASYTTASNSDTGLRYYLFTVSARTNLSAATNNPTVTGKGLTWTQVNTTPYDTTDPTRKRITTFRAYGTATAGALTIDFGGQTQSHCIWILDEVTGMDTSGTNGSGAIVQSTVEAVNNTGTGVDQSVTLAAFANATSNSTYAVFAQDLSSATDFTPEAGLTKLGSTGAFSISGGSVYRRGQDLTPSVVWNSNTAGGTSRGAIGIELKAAAAAPTGQDITPPLLTNNQTFYSATVSGGAAVIAPPLLSAEPTIFAPTVVNNAIDVQHVLSGAITSTTARVKARLSAETTTATLEYATNAGFTGSSSTAPVTVTSGNDLVATFELSGLTANTQYYYRVVLGGVPDNIVGKFKTYGVGQYNFTFAFSGDADIVDNQNVYTRIIARNPTFFFALGDTPYIDSNATSVTPYQTGYKSWFGDATVSSMLQEFPYQYVWDDHDYGLNNSDSSNPGKPFVQSVYRQHIPHYPLEVSDSIYHSFVVGRVLFLVTDLRSERTGSTFMSTAQMTWFKGKITEASNNPNIGLIVWANSIPWIDTSGTSTDTWDGADAQRTEIANHINTVGMQDNFCIISADAHMVAADNGTNSEGGFPVFQSAPLNRVNSTKGGPYTFGPYASSNGQYSIMSITDNGNDIDINVKGYDGSDTQLYTYDFTAVIPSQDVAPALLTNAQTFYNPAVTVGAVTITPALYTNEPVFFAPTITTGAIGVTAPLVTNNQTFFAPTIGRGAVTITPELLTNNQTFFAPTINNGAVTITPAVLVNEQTFFAPTVGRGAVTVSAPLVTNTETFFAPTVGRGAVTVSAPLVTNGNTIYSASISVGVATILAPLYTNNQTFFAPSISVTLTAPLVTNTETFFAPTITTGAVTISAPLVTNGQEFFEPVISLGNAPKVINPSLFTNNQTFFAPTITTGAVSVSAPLVTNTETFYDVTVTPGAINITTPLISEVQTFFAPTLTTGAVNVSMPLLVSEPVILPMIVSSGVTFIEMPLLSATPTIFTPILNVGSVNVVMPIVTNTSVIFAPMISNGATNIEAPLLTNTEIFYSPRLGRQLTMPLVSSTQFFYSPLVSIEKKLMAERNVTIFSSNRTVTVEN